MYWDSPAKQDAIRDELNTLHERLAYLIGCHQDAGAVPADELRALLASVGTAWPGTGPNGSCRVACPDRVRRRRNTVSVITDPTKYS